MADQKMIRSMKPGDWVRFYREGRLVIGEVRYVHEREAGRTWYNVSTDAGPTADNAILEIRRSTGGSET